MNKYFFILLICLFMGCEHTYQHKNTFCMTHKKEKMKLLKQEVSRYLSAHPNDSIDWDTQFAICINETQKIQKIVFDFTKTDTKGKESLKILMIDSPFKYVMYEEFFDGFHFYIKTEDWIRIIHFLHRHKCPEISKYIGGIRGYYPQGYNMYISDKEVLDFYDIPDSIKKSERVRNATERKKLRMEVNINNYKTSDSLQYDYMETIFLYYYDSEWIMDIIPNIKQCKTIPKTDSILKKYPNTRIEPFWCC